MIPLRTPVHKKRRPRIRSLVTPASAIDVSRAGKPNATIRIPKPDRTSDSRFMPSLSTATAGNKDSKDMTMAQWATTNRMMERSKGWRYM